MPNKSKPSRTAVPPVSLAAVPPKAEANNTSRWQASDEDWRLLKLIGRYRGRKLAALSLGLNPATGVRKRLADQQQLLDRYKGLLSLLRNRASSSHEVGAVRYVADSANDPLRLDPQRSASDRVFNLIDYVDFMRGRAEIDRRMTDIAEELRSHPDWSSSANTLRLDGRSPKQKEAQTKVAQSMAKVLLGMLVARCGLEMEFPWKDSETPPKYKLKRGVWPDLVKAVSESGLMQREDDRLVENPMHPRTVRAAVSSAISLLGEGVVRKAIEGREGSKS